MFPYVIKMLLFHWYLGFLSVQIILPWNPSWHTNLNCLWSVYVLTYCCVNQINMNMNMKNNWLNSYLMIRWAFRWAFRFDVRLTSCSRLVDCLQRDGARDPVITWSHVWLSWKDPASRFMHVGIFLIQSASLIHLVCRCAFLTITSTLSQSMTWFCSTAWSVMADLWDLWVTLLSLDREAGEQDDRWTSKRSH